MPPKVQLESALKRVAEFQSEQDVEGLRNVARNSAEPYKARVEAASSLRYLGEPQDADLFSDLVNHSEAGADSASLFWNLDLAAPRMLEALEQVAFDASRHVDLRGYAFSAMAESSPDKTRTSAKLLDIVRSQHESEPVRVAALRSLGAMGDAAPISELQALTSEPTGLDMASILSAMASTGQADARRVVVKHLLSGSVPGYSRQYVAEDLHRGSRSWQMVADDVLEELRRGRWQGEDIDAKEVVRFLKPPNDQGVLDSRAISEYLLHASLKDEDDDTRSEILATLLVAAENGDKLRAGRRINEFVEQSALPAESLRQLRIFVGGTSALDSVIGTLHANLRVNFEGPIRQLNDNTREMWQRTIKQAQYGFVARLAMSVMVFLIGIAFMVLAVVLFLRGDEADRTMLFGSGISLVSGLGMMLAMVYRGPLREIRQSVSDLGIASAAFIAYVHRVLEISHTFSYYYLKEQITFDEMQKSSELIREAMRDTVGLLSDPRAVHNASKYDA